MKRYFIILIMIYMIVTLSSCNSKVKSLFGEQQKAIDNSIEYIKNSSFRFKENINYDIVKIELAKENTWEMVRHPDYNINKNMVDTTDLIITIGDMNSFHNYAIIVCDSTTYKVIGNIPIE